MSSKFESFDRSPMGAFIQSPLGARLATGIAEISEVINKFEGDHLYIGGRFNSIGDADAVTQNLAILIRGAYTGSIDTLDATPSDNTFTVTIDGESESVVGDTDPATTAANLITALNGSAKTSFQEYSWFLPSTSGSEVIGKKNDGGMFSATLSISGPGAGSVTDFISDSLALSLVGGSLLSGDYVYDIEIFNSTVYNATRGGAGLAGQSSGVATGIITGLANISDGYLYILGYTSDTLSSSNVVFKKYDGQNSIDGPALSGFKAIFGCTVVDGNIYIIGADDDASEPYFRAAVFDGDSWTLGNYTFGGPAEFFPNMIADWNGTPIMAVPNQKKYNLLHSGEVEFAPLIDFAGNGYGVYGDIGGSVRHVCSVGSSLYVGGIFNQVDVLDTPESAPGSAIYVSGRFDPVGLTRIHSLYKETDGTIYAGSQGQESFNKRTSITAFENLAETDSSLTYISSFKDARKIPFKMFSITPDNGSVLGGDTITIKGFGFTNATEIQFDGVDAESVTFVDSKELTVETPAGSSDGFVDIKAITGSDAHILFDAYRYDDDPPVVTITNPTGGSLFFESGEDINFTGTATDTEDGNISANIEWSSDVDGSLGTGASINISTLSDGEHTITASIYDSASQNDIDTVTLEVKPLHISSLNPNSGPSSGGTTVTITGWGFSASTSVTFDGNPGTNFNYISENEIEIDTPPGSAGFPPAEVEVTDGADSDTAAFFYA